MEFNIKNIPKNNLKMDLERFLRVLESNNFTYYDKIKYIIKCNRFNIGNTYIQYFTTGLSYFHPSTSILIDKNNIDIFKNIIDEHNKIQKNLNNITLTLKNILTLQDIDKYIKCLYNLICYEHYLTQSMKIIKDNFTIFLYILKENKNTTDFEFYSDDLNKLKIDYNNKILLLDYIFTKTYINIRLISNYDKIIAKNSMSVIIKKNSRFINSLLNTKYLEFFTLFFEKSELIEE